MNLQILETNLINILVKFLSEWLKIFFLQIACLSIILAYVHLSIYMKRQEKYYV